MPALRKQRTSNGKKHTGVGRGRTAGSIASYFKKGNSGRPVGAPNRWSREMKECIREAMAIIGLDGKGTGEVTGFFVKVGLRRPEVLAMIGARPAAGGEGTGRGDTQRALSHPRGDRL